MFFKRKKAQTPQPVKPPTPYDITFSAVALGEIVESHGTSSGISWVTCVKDGLDVHVEVYSFGTIRTLRVGKARERKPGERYRPAEDRKQVTFGDANDEKIAKAAYHRIREDSDAKVRAATSEFFEGFENG